MTPAMLAGGDALLGGGDRAAFARALYDELVLSVAGLVAEVKIAGLRTTYVEEGTLWHAVHVARIEAGLPICGYEKRKIPFDGERIFKTGLPTRGHRKCWIPLGVGIADVIKRAEDEAFALLKANWSIVKRVTNALCKRDRLTSIDLDDIIAGKRRRPKRKQATRYGEADAHHAVAWATFPCRRLPSKSCK
jgi:hypothetical protein